MSDLKAKKKMLVAESEVYRELLKLEVRTLKAYGMHTKRRLSSLGSYLPLMMTGIPILTRMLGRRRRRGHPLMRLGSLFLLGWKTYRWFAPFVRRGRARKSEPAETAAAEYLSKRL